MTDTTTEAAAVGDERERLAERHEPPPPPSPPPHRPPVSVERAAATPPATLNPVLLAVAGAACAGLLALTAAAFSRGAAKVRLRLSFRASRSCGVRASTWRRPARATRRGAGASPVGTVAA
jgi:hypothetical protein